MKFLVRMLFRGARLILGPVMLAYERIAAPKGIIRTPEAQARIDALTQGMTLYQYKTCPFCIKVRHTLARLSLNIKTRDAQNNAAYREELRSMGGRVKVPCLRIDDADGNSEWLYESEAIKRYLSALVG